MGFICSSVERFMRKNSARICALSPPRSVSLKTYINKKNQSITFSINFLQNILKIIYCDKDVYVIFTGI